MINYDIFYLKHGLVLLVIHTTDRFMPYHIANRNTLLLGTGLSETIEIPELDNEKFNNYMYYSTQNKDEIEVIYVPFKLLESDQ